MKFILSVLFSFYFASFSHAKETLDLQLPDLGDSSEKIISPEQDKALGEAFFRSLHRRIKILDDPEIQHYIQSLGRQLVKHSETPAKPFHFFIVLDNNINAFAGPGGYIGINSGLFTLTEVESELASVMAHEVAHISQRHLYRAFEAADRLSIPAAAATLAAILLGTQSTELGQAALVAVQAGTTQFQIDFTRENEKEADRIGMQTLSKAHYNPRSMPVFFERLQQSTRYYGRGIPEFLRTHPVSASRIADTRGRAEQYAYRQYPDSTGYLLSKTKLRVLSSADDDALQKHFSRQQHQGTPMQRAAMRYGMALLHLKNQQFKSAERLFSDLSKQYPHIVQFMTARARTALDSGNFDQALHLYKQALRRFPQFSSIKLETIEAFLQNDQPHQAKAYLETLPFSIKKQPAYFELLAQTHSALGQTVESHRFLAEYYFAKGQTEQAIQQIKQAKQAQNINFYSLAILDEREKIFVQEDLLRKQKKSIF